MHACVTGRNSRPGQVKTAIVISTPNGSPRRLGIDPKVKLCWKKQRKNINHPRERLLARDRPSGLHPSMGYVEVQALEGMLVEMRLRLGVTYEVYNAITVHLAMHARGRPITRETQARRIALPALLINNKNFNKQKKKIPTPTQRRETVTFPVIANTRVLRPLMYGALHTVSHLRLFNDTLMRSAARRAAPAPPRVTVPPDNDYTRLSLGSFVSIKKRTFHRPHPYTSDGRPTLKFNER
ncbi:hypothetical protein EVAR_5740_1 [Eumeta japonica]|uniref:Uncharacterized protein n=1 Tax=Eumeta variegata TaxID=151549 RepID=A0A4C1T6X0_EUMVA|nr:hypothetical protein EVAR_5740_1 [Eumeta japonica]